MAGLDPAIHVLLVVPRKKTCMPGRTAEKRFGPFDVVVVPFPYAGRLAENRRRAMPN